MTRIRPRPPFRFRFASSTGDFPKSLATRAAALLPGLAIHTAVLCVAGLVLVSAGQPIFTDDLWWHLKLGEAYAAAGPWLPADPALFAAPGPPAPAAWLADTALYQLEQTFGFMGLRIAHVLFVAAILGLAWLSLRRASGSAWLASLGTIVFAAMSAYRLFQLRPHLFSILAALVLAMLLIQRDEPPGWRRIAAAVCLFAVWANVHAGFVVGPALLGAALGGALLAALQLRRDPVDSARSRTRAARLATALVLGLLATLANPSGFEPHLLYFSAGGSTPELGLVADEWTRLSLFDLPTPNLPPSPLAWALVWALVAATPAAVCLQEWRVRRQRARRRRGESARSGSGVEFVAIDPALVAVALVSLALLLSAVRFLWLGIFPLLLLGRAARALGLTRGRSRRSLGWAAAVASLLLVPAFVEFGDWPMISRAVHPTTYASPYLAPKYFAHAVWFLRDAELEGRLFNDYSHGSFLGYWLSPRMQVFVNGSLNVPKELMEARHAIVGWERTRDGATPLELLDRYRVDVFFGTGLPTTLVRNRPVPSTTTHLEHTPSWVLVFRNLRSAVYLRRHERNRSNLERVAAYYAARHVPFDPETGLDLERAIRAAPRWAAAQGVLPFDFQAANAARRSPDPELRRLARDRVAAVYTALGLHERAIAIDRSLLATEPASIPAARRLVWSLLHLRRFSEARDAAEELAARASEDDGLSAVIVDAARRADRRQGGLPADESAGVGDTPLLARLPVMTRLQARFLLTGVQEPEARLQ